MKCQGLPLPAEGSAPGGFHGGPQTLQGMQEHCNIGCLNLDTGMAEALHAQHSAKPTPSHSLKRMQVRRRDNMASQL